MQQSHSLETETPQNLQDKAYQQAFHKPVAKHKGMYILPNLITIASLFCGLTSLRYSILGRFATTEATSLAFFEWAALSILLAVLCDGLDGSVARLTRTQSSFGVQLDSLCDLVSFGVAPAFLAYNFALYAIDNLGFGIAFVFTACGALRLARFNVQSSLGKTSGNFTGIPIPMAASPIAVYVLAQRSLETNSFYEIEQLQIWASILRTHITWNAWILFGLMLLLSFGMISTIEYVSHKRLRLPKKGAFKIFSILVIVLSLLLIWDFRLGLAILLLLYCIHGPIMWIFTRKKNKNLVTSNKEAHT